MEQPSDIISLWLAGLPTRKGGGAITAETELIDEGILDSIALLELVSFLEEKFHITLPVEEFVPENFRTAAAIAALAMRLGGRVT
jgi:acyl carrier protein